MPAPSRFESHVDEPVLDRRLIPAALATERWFARFHALQQGLTQYYILYILIAVVVLLLWAMPLGQVLLRLFAR
jgi:hydrogenase-4 component B